MHWAVKHMKKHLSGVVWKQLSAIDQGQPLGHFFPARSLPFNRAHVKTHAALWSARPPTPQHTLKNKMENFCPPRIVALHLHLSSLLPNAPSKRRISSKEKHNKTCCHHFTHHKMNKEKCPNQSVQSIITYIYGGWSISQSRKEAEAVTRSLCDYDAKISTAALLSLCLLGGEGNGDKLDLNTPSLGIFVTACCLLSFKPFIPPSCPDSLLLSEFCLLSQFSVLYTKPHRVLKPSLWSLLFPVLKRSRSINCIFQNCCIKHFSTISCKKPCRFNHQVP